MAFGLAVTKDITTIDSTSLETTQDETGFVWRHLGPRHSEIKEMLASLNMSSLDELVSKVVPAKIRLQSKLNLPHASTEAEVLARLSELAAKNSIFKSYIGTGYSDCITPTVIQRNILENPGWYTQYTPYQPEISQGRLEALINFQTVITDLTGLEIANASMLDEGTAVAEAMTLAYRVKSSEGKTKFFVAENCHPQTIEVVVTRAEPLGIEVVIASPEHVKIDSTYFAAALQYPTTDGAVCDYSKFCEVAHSSDALVIAACDLLSLVLLKPPAEWGADIAVGSAQRFGVPMEFGGPHAAYMATKMEYARQLPGRLVGVSKDASGKAAYRLTLQTREQHIKRDKATSNICTAQVLLAVIAGMYAVYHGPEGLKRIASKVSQLTSELANSLVKAGLKLKFKNFFDTIQIQCSVAEQQSIRKRAEASKVNFRYLADGAIGISLDERTTVGDIQHIVEIVTAKSASTIALSEANAIQESLKRTSKILTHPVFSCYHSETEFQRYVRRLESRDLSLTTSMIPLGSCTMKLNAATEMQAVTWPAFSALHPFIPLSQAQGYLELIAELESMLAEITGLPGVSVQPNAGSQGEYAGLLCIREFHKQNKQDGRNICLIPQSAHGTNPASAVMAGMEVVVVRCDEAGNVDIADLKAKAEENSACLAALMITYPSTHGVFEEGILEIADIVHQHGGQVYMDGANLNAQVGLCRPGDFGVDVCHLNLHKTFCIPHGGGGPGVGPICVAEHLKPFLPGHPHLDSVGKDETNKARPVISAAPWGSAAVLIIPWAYIKMMGAAGLTLATKVAILNANYIGKRLHSSFPVLYRGREGFVAHECILDLRNLKRQIGIEAQDVAKRLMDYGFHAPTVSFPVVETLMVEPTESEAKAELDRFCEAMIGIASEIKAIQDGKVDKLDNVLKNAPHTAEVVSASSWTHSYTREEAAYPAEWLRVHKFWPAVSRIDSTYGDRNLFCSCVPLE